MKSFAIYVAGFASGWAARMTLDSFRSGVVALVAAGYRVVESARRHVGVEREYVEDLFAEGRARYEAERVPGAFAAEAPAQGTDAASPADAEGAAESARRVRAA